MEDARRVRRIGINSGMSPDTDPHRPAKILTPDGREDFSGSAVVVGVARLPKEDPGRLQLEILIDLGSGQMLDCALDPAPRMLSRLVAGLLVDQSLLVDLDSTLAKFQARYRGPWSGAVCAATQNAQRAALQLYQTMTKES